MKTQNGGRIATILFMAIATGVQGQTVTSLPWHKRLGLPVLGRGLSIHPNHISVTGGTGVDATKYAWQLDSQNLSLLDYKDMSSTIQSLNINAWGEADGFTASGSFSVDWSKYSAFQSNHRRWEVHGTYYKTAFLPAVALTSSALAYVNDPANFAAKFGDYAVTGITYRRSVSIVFDAMFTNSLSQSQFDGAVQASYGMFSGGAGVSAFFQSLQSFAQTTVTVSVEGQNGGPVLSAAIGSTNDLNGLIVAVQQLFSTWSITPTDPTKAGIVDTVYVTPYKAIPKGPSVTPDYSPKQTDLAFAIAQYVYLDTSRGRLIQIQNQDKNANPTLKAYIAHKLSQVTVIRAAAGAYITSLHNNTPPATPPDLSFQFDDPDVVKWRVLLAWSTGYTNYVDVEIYSNAPLTVTSKREPYRLVWYDTATPYVNNGHLWWGFGRQVLESLSYRTSIDPETGIPHRFAIMYSNPGGIPGGLDTWVTLADYGGQSFANAYDWNGGPAPALFIPASNFVPSP